MESKRRSIAKTVSWRILATIITLIVAYSINSYSDNKVGNGELALLIALLDTSIKFGVYFFHERAWNKIDYGREVAVKDFEI